MSNVVALFDRSDFGPDTIAIMARAYEEARKRLHDKGQPPLVQEVIVARIIAAVRTGERDPDRLCLDALMALGSKAEFD